MEVSGVNGAGESAHLRRGWLDLWRHLLHVGANERLANTAPQGRLPGAGQFHLTKAIQFVKARTSVRQ